MLQQVKRDAEAALGRTVDEAVVTVPAYFGDAQRQATRDAAAIAGITVERIINEPTAAALAYGLHERHREMTAVVLDLGGGTFDVTVLQIMEGVVEIQASSGDTRLGGEDFDLALAELIATQLEREHKLDVRAEPYGWARIKEACEQAEAPVRKRGGPRCALRVAAARRTQIHVELPLSRAQADPRGAVARAHGRADPARAPRRAARPSKLHEVLLVGGATRAPCVAKAMAQLFGRLPLRTLPADEAIALGAAVQAGLKQGDAALGDMIVTDVAPFSLGVESSRKLGRQVVSGLFTPILERGTVIPASREESFHTLSDNQTTIEFGVYQGEHSMVRDNKKLGAYTIRGLDPLPAGEHSFRVRFTYDLNGILEVDMTIEKTGKTETLVIEGSPGRLTSDQLREARAAMGRLKFHPRESLPNATLLARADALFVELVGAERDELRDGIAAFRAGLESQDDALITQYRDRLVRLVNSRADSRDRRELLRRQLDVRRREILRHVRGVLVPVSGNMPSCCAKRNTICGTVISWRFAIMLSAGRVRTARFAVSSENGWYTMFAFAHAPRTARSQPRSA